MPMLIDGREILDNFQMDVPVLVEIQDGIDTAIISYDPFLPANNAISSSDRMNAFIQGMGGWDDVNHAIWYTTEKVPKGAKVKFTDKYWTIVNVDDYEATTFSNVNFYKLNESGILQAKGVSLDDEW
jgi:hypothetical protein